MFKKFFLSVITVFSLSNNLFASDEFSTLSFQMDLDQKSAAAVFVQRDDLCSFVDHCFEKYKDEIFFWHDGPASKFPHVTLEVFKKDGQVRNGPLSCGENFTRDETRTMFQSFLVLCGQNLHPVKQGVTLDNLEPLMILKLIDQDGARTTKYIRHYVDLNDLANSEEGKMFHSFTIALEVTDRNVSDYISSTSQKLAAHITAQSNKQVVVNQTHVQDVAHVTLLKFFPIKKNMMKSFKQTGSYDCLDQGRKVNNASIVALRYFFRKIDNSHECPRLYCNSVSLNPMKVKDVAPQAMQLRQKFDRSQEVMNMSTGCYPLSSACEYAFRNKYEMELAKDKQREAYKRFTPKLEVVYRALNGENVQPGFPGFEAKLEHVEDVQDNDYIDSLNSYITTQQKRVSDNQEFVRKQEKRIADNQEFIQRQMKRIADNKAKNDRNTAGNIKDAEAKIADYQGRIYEAREEILNLTCRILDAEKSIKDTEFTLSILKK